MAKLCIVPTPIGNLEDITLRALRLLKEADIILAEDTRQSMKLLQHYNISKKLISFHQNNEHKVLQNVIQLIAQHQLVCLVSDAGTPGISDPGFLLVRECIKNEIPVECLPGPAALIPALIQSGFPCDQFIFEGFLPHKKGRQTQIQKMLNEHRTVILYESPYRLMKTLEQLKEILGPEREICVCRELTKMFEETKRGTLLEVTEHFSKKEIKGEIVIVLKGKDQ